MMVAPRENLGAYFLPYQVRVIEDRSKHILIEKGRRTGFTYAISYKAVEDCMRQCEDKKRRKTDWWFSSADETAAKEFIEYCGFWVRDVFNLAAVTIGVESLLVEKKYIQIQVVRFPNGVKIVALSSNPRAMRSKGGNVVLDEFAYHDDPRAMWRAAGPVPRWGGQFIVLSTHNGEETIFHQQCERAKKEPGGFWSYHYCSLDTAISQGLVEKILQLDRPATDEEKKAFRAECRSECLTQEDFDQEYLCVASSASSALLSYELIDSCEDAGADFDWNPERPRLGPIYSGTDVGRTHDLTFTPFGEKVGDVLWTRAIQVFRNIPFRVQYEGIAGLYRMTAVVRAFIDGFGIGTQLAEDLAAAFGAIRVQSVQVNTTNLVLGATRLKSMFEDRTIRIPRSDELREALHRPRKIQGLAGGTVIKLARDAKGHCDEFVGYALLALAAHEGGDCGPVREEAVACQASGIVAAGSPWGPPELGTRNPHASRRRGEPGAGRTRW